MSFFVGAILFVALVGVLDAKIPWPKSGTKIRGRKAGVN
jgi:hypothetical protein